jgi:hypothetical protein
MWNGKTISVVLPTYNEKDSIADTIRAFDKLGVVDDILVINNNAADGTSEEVATTSAREIVETRQGYGAAIRRGLVEVDTDLICVCEPDGLQPPGPDKTVAFHHGMRLRGGFADGVQLHLGRRQHGLVPAMGQLGGRESDRAPVQHLVPQ